MIREGNSTDLQKVHELSKVIFPLYKEETMESRFNDRKNFYLSIYEEENSFGYMCGHDVKDKYHIWMTAVSPGQTGKGIGKQLLDHQLEFARSKRYKKMTVNSSTVWKNMLLLLIKNDFIIKGYRSEAYGPNPGIFFERDL